MKAKQIFCLAMGLLCMHMAFSQKQKRKSNRMVVVVEGPLPAGYQEDNIELEWGPMIHDKMIYPYNKEKASKPLKNGYAKFEIVSNTPKYIFPGIFSSGMAYIIEPGDSLHVRWANNMRLFSGNAGPKFQLQKEIEYLLQSIYYPQGLARKRDTIASLNEYLQWSSFLDKATKKFMDFLDSHKKEISDVAYLKFKNIGLSEIEKIRLSKFHSLRRSRIVGPTNQHGVTNEDLCRIYDSTMNNAASRWLRYERDFIFDPDYVFEMLHEENYRRRGKFFRTKESDTAILGQDPADAFVYIYNRAKEIYKGKTRENVMRFTLSDYRGAMRMVGFTSKTEALLKDYYTQPGYPESKKSVREFEIERKAKYGLGNIPQFNLTDNKGNVLNNEELSGKIVVLDFWFTGCTGCIQMAPALRKAEEYFANTPDIAFVGVSIDRKMEQWLKSIADGRYTSGKGIQVYTNGEGADHDIIKKFLVEGYPTLEIVGPDGQIINVDKRKIDPRNDDAQALIALLKKQLAIKKDGPYVLYENGKQVAYTVDDGWVDKKENSSGQPLSVVTDQNTNFPVSLIPALQVQPVEYAKPEKLFALSDIEGNFDQFRKLLQANKIIDENYNWIFGKGHLVFAGDMFDRGLQVTECLWLIYSLEEKAKVAGGYVHFILGNHEIMNMQGVHSYAKKKYKDNAGLMNKTLAQLYNEDSELGRWLRTKNIMEKIGDILFLHGGVSRKLNHLPLTIVDINQMARPNYATAKNNYGDGNVDVIMDPFTSPFWYRSYYDDKPDMARIIDSSLQKFNVKHIVTGHTIVADTISIHYGGKVINTDTKHAEGRSEALLVEGNTYYRVNSEGQKVLLFGDDRKRAF
jgi:thiol-disulfide isomerase/thioredoxin